MSTFMFVIACLAPPIILVAPRLWKMYRLRVEFNKKLNDLLVRAVAELDAAA